MIIYIKGLDLEKLNTKCLHVNESVYTITLKFRNVTSFVLLKIN